MQSAQALGDECARTFRRHATQTAHEWAIRFDDTSPASATQSVLEWASTLDNLS